MFSRPWLDGPTALAAVLAHSGQMTLATTVAVPVLRGPAATAKILAAIDLLSGGRLVVGLGPGSSARDYELVGVPFEERWKRLDESVLALRAYWRADDVAFEGAFYSTAGFTLVPTPAQRPGPPIWIGSWGSAAGLRRVARLADGWLASGYNTSPELFAQAWSDVQAELSARGRDVAGFPNGIATMWCYVTEDRARADAVLADVLAPMLNRPVDELRAILPIGSAEECAEKLLAYARAGAQRVFLWPLADERAQLFLGFFSCFCLGAPFFPIFGPPPPPNRYERRGGAATRLSFGSMTPRFSTTSKLPSLAWAMYMFMRT